MVPLNQSLYLQPSLDRLRVAVLEQNRPGSVEGLLAHHVLKDDPRISVEWQVGCTQEWIDTEFKPTHLDHVAALGYFLWAQPTSKFHGSTAGWPWTDARERRFQGRTPESRAQSNSIAWHHLGCLALGDCRRRKRSPGAGKCSKKCARRASRTSIRWCLTFSSEPLTERYRATAHSAASLYELAFADWAIRHQMQQSEPSLQQLNRRPPEAYCFKRPRIFASNRHRRRHSSGLA